MTTLHDQMFLAQSTLERWLDAGKAEFNGSSVTLPLHDRSYRLEGAVRFEAAVAGEGLRLEGKVMTEQQVQELGGELMEDSVVFGEHAFTVRAGYLATREV